MYKNKKVLIIDDSSTERNILARISKELGFQVLEADSGELGIKMAMEHKPDLILMDVVMSGINGFQATKQICNHVDLKHIPVIMCTSKSEEIDKVWSVRQGAKGYVVKPIMQEYLEEEIKKLL